LDIASQNPQLCCQVGIIVWKNIHPFVGQGVKEIECADEQEGNANEQEISVFHPMSRIPGQYKNAAHNDHGENLGDAVEQQVAVKTGQI